MPGELAESMRLAVRGESDEVEEVIDEVSEDGVNGRETNVLTLVTC